MDKDIPLISICIPTYNRAEILNKTLKKYVDDLAFDERTEIVISDNCSTDHTEIIVNSYIQHYKNIKYKKLSRNIGAAFNMCAVLSMGRGLYLKLVNDSVSMKPGALDSILNNLLLNKKDMKPILFYQNISFLHSNETICCQNINQLVANVSFYSTWIANFGIWRKDFDSLENKNRLCYLQFPHTDWTFKLSKINSGIVVKFNDYYYNEELKSKGGYNIFQTFSVYYLSIYDEYIDSGILEKKIFNKERYRLFRYMLISWFLKLHSKKKSIYYFDRNNSIKIMMKNYKRRPYFYIGITYAYLYLFFERTKMMFMTFKGYTSNM